MARKTPVKRKVAKKAAKKVTKKKTNAAAVRDARSLADLMRIRAFPENRRYLDSINGNLGTALGFKKRANEPVSDEPAVIAFVPQKIHSNWIDDKVDIRSELSVPGENGNPGIRCSLDIVEGGKTETARPIVEAQTELVKRLRGGDPQIWPGSQLAILNSREVEILGTLGVFVRQQSSGFLGFLTNDHVAFPNRSVYHPRHPSAGGLGKAIGIPPAVNAHVGEVPPLQWYGAFATEPEAMVHVDCEFIKCSSLLGEDRICPEIMGAGEFGPLYRLDLNKDMSSKDSCPIGQKVVKLGRTTGLTEGTVTAFAYEWFDGANRTCYTDLLIAPNRVAADGGREISLPFSERGDSGSLILLKEGMRPLALLWGGFLEKLQKGKGQENWTYATRLAEILDELDLDLVRRKGDV